MPPVAGTAGRFYRGGMARYVARVHSSLPVPEAFALVADMRQFEAWDPGVSRVTQVAGSGAGPGATFDVTVTLPPGLTLRYVTEEFDAPVDPKRPREALLVARTPLFSSVDRVSAVPVPDGSLITYDADVRLAGPLRLGDLGLRVVFGWIGGRAENGLREAATPAPVAA
jgi:hypothetical protein